jgi:hypothetical protein
MRRGSFGPTPRHLRVSQEQSGAGPVLRSPVRRRSRERAGSQGGPTVLRDPRKAEAIAEPAGRPRATGKTAMARPDLKGFRAQGEGRGTRAKRQRPSGPRWEAWQLSQTKEAFGPLRSEGQWATRHLHGQADFQSLADRSSRQRELFGARCVGSFGPKGSGVRLNALFTRTCGGIHLTARE